MRTYILILGAMIVFASCKNNQGNAESKDSSTVIADVKEAISNDALKSALYETETLMPGGMGTTNTKVIFDDYGKKSRTEIQTAISFGGKSMNTSSNSVMTDGYVYTWQTGSKSGSKFKLDESKFDPNNLDFSRMSEELRKKMNFKEEGTETVDGRECKVASFNAEQMSGKVWMWKQIPVKMEMSVVGKTITSTLKKLEENPSISAGTFDVPADIEFKELNLPATAQK